MMIRMTNMKIVFSDSDMFHNKWECVTSTELLQNIIPRVGEYVVFDKVAKIIHIIVENAYKSKSYKGKRE